LHDLKKNSSAVLRTFASKAVITNIHEQIETLDKGKTSTNFMVKSSSSVLKPKKNLFTRSSFNFFTSSEETNQTFFQKMTKANTLSRERKQKYLNEHDFCVQNDFPKGKKQNVNINPINNNKLALSKKMKTLQYSDNDYSNIKSTKIISNINTNNILSYTTSSAGPSTRILLKAKPAIKGSKFLNNFSVLNYSQMEKFSTERTKKIGTDRFVSKQFHQKREKKLEGSKLGEGEQNIVITKINHFKKKDKVVK
jgi:hypothetical protein